MDPEAVADLSFADLVATLRDAGWAVSVRGEASSAVNALRSDTFVAMIVSDGSSGQRVRDARHCQRGRAPTPNCLKFPCH